MLSSRSDQPFSGPSVPVWLARSGEPAGTGTPRCGPGLGAPWPYLHGGSQGRAGRSPAVIGWETWTGAWDPPWAGLCRSSFVGKTGWRAAAELRPGGPRSGFSREATRYHSGCPGNSGRNNGRSAPLDYQGPARTNFYLPSRRCASVFMHRLGSGATEDRRLYYSRVGDSVGSFALGGRGIRPALPTELFSVFVSSAFWIPHFRTDVGRGQQTVRPPAGGTTGPVHCRQKATVREYQHRRPKAYGAHTNKGTAEAWQPRLDANP